MARGRSESTLVRRLSSGALERRPDELIVEEPLEIRLDGNLVTTTMRTPGDDFELAAGFCLTGGYLDGVAPTTCRYCGTGSAVETEFNVVSVETGGRAPVPEPRLQGSTSSCGLCGTEAIDELAERLHPLPAHDPWDADLLVGIPDRARASQDLFSRTGAVHAAAEFDRDGRIGLVREDIGRHNAVDKVIGRLLFDDALPATGSGLYVSGRASFELVQKAWAAGFEAMVAVSAPSSLAVQTARAAGMTLAGFARSDSLNLYSPAD